MKHITRTVACAVVAALVCAVAPLRAHHSHAMFDGSKETEITGVVTAVRYGNPHVYVRVEASQRDGVPLEPRQTWAIEMSTMANMTQRGLTPDTMPVGATMTVRVNPLFSGGYSGNYTHMVMIKGVRNGADGTDWKPATVAAR